MFWTRKTKDCKNDVLSKKETPETMTKNGVWNLLLYNRIPKSHFRYIISVI